MDIRCKTCSKLFRIADEKIAGKGIRFKCSQCSDVITVLREDLEREKRAREAAANRPPETEPQRVIPLAPPPPPPPASPRQAAAQPPKVKEEVHEEEIPQAPKPSGLDDFDFSMPHEAAAADRATDSGGVPDPFADLKAEQEEGSGPEISISEEEEKAAEEAFQFPADIISEPSRKSTFETPSGESETPPPGPSTADQKRQAVSAEDRLAETFRKAQAYEAPRGAGIASPEPEAPTVLQEEEQIDLGAALAIPGGVATDEERPVPAAPAAPRATPSASGSAVHPFASGNTSGAVAGIGCGIPVVVMLTAGFSMLVKFLPVFSSLPFLHLAVAAGAGIVGLGVIIGIVLAVMQARAAKKLFFLGNILTGTVLGAGVGIGIHLLLSFVLGKGMDTAGLVDRLTGWLVVSFLLSTAVVIARRLFVRDKEESFDEPLTGAQKAGLILSVLVILGSVYADGALTGRMEQLGQEALVKMKQMTTPEGLTVVNAEGHIDPASGDLVVTGTIRNSLSVQKSGWYLVVDVYDSSQNVITRMRMVNGAQVFGLRELDVLAKRGRDINDVVKRFSAAVMRPQDAAIPAKGSLPFEMRLPEPPSTVAGFLPDLKPFEPEAVLQELAAGLKR